MGDVCHRLGALACLLNVIEELVGIGGRAFHFRCLHYEDYPLDVVEEVEE